ncbi:MAG: alcohol dehydrogenase catalytic domain-containing protein [Chloroflexi bacterium]|nr:alcohol dehydrogenase catalytic domain-containing protein [Chloroflexota bacterium]
MTQPTMLSARFLGEEKITLEEVPIPEPGPGEVLLRTSYCGLCGSDKRLYYRGAAVTPGHELTGTVAKNGPGVVAPLGQRVAVYIHRYCGKCKFCLVGETNHCSSAGGLVGWQTPGGYAQYLVAPAANLIPLPDDISDAEGVLLLDTIGTAAEGIRKSMHNATSKARSQNAAVIGCGPLGLGSQLILSSLGWADVYVYDPAQPRLDVAVAWGGKAITPDAPAFRSSFGVVVEASGHHTARALAMSLVETGGSLLLLGENDNPWTITPSPELRRKDCAYIRSYYFPIGAAQANMDLLRARRTQYREMLTPIVPLEGLQAAFADFAAGKTLKPLVKPNTNG